VSLADEIDESLSSLKDGLMMLCWCYSWSIRNTHGP
jgi:hypothetical protein